MPFYNLVVFLYGLLIRAASTFNRKAAKWTEGRSNWKKTLKGNVSQFKGHKVLWVHCASYGEFEQGRPLMEAMRSQAPGTKILLTFFSPSGYEAFKNWNGADAVAYLPLDRRSNADTFLDIVKPDIIVFVKYEFWLHYLRVIQRRGIPNFLVSATFKPHHPFFKWYGSIFKRSLASFTWMFLQDEKSLERLQRIGFKNCSVAGDTRFDRVLTIRDEQAEVAGIIKFKGDCKLLVAGSTWAGDEEILISSLGKILSLGVKLIMAPHEVNEKRIQSLTQILKTNNVSYSLYSEKNFDPASNVLIIDCIGLLSKIYRYGTVAYVGGGFEQGLHNTLEPTVYGIPVIFAGTDYTKYNEAADLVNLGAGIVIHDSTTLVSELTDLVNDRARLDNIKKELFVYFERNRNATQKIMTRLMPFIS